MTSSTFADLGLAPFLVDTLSDLGYEQPSPIQARAIPLLLAGHNLLGVAQTGTGKTAAFALPLLHNLEPTRRSPQVLILTPTRELAIQVAEACQSYARRLKDFHVLPLYGGQGMVGQLRGLQRGAQVVVGTPGRTLDHLRRGSLSLDGIGAVVLDEADEMLRMGFIDDVEAILAQTPDTARRALFSATMPPAIQRIADHYLGDAEKVHIQSATRTVASIRQRYLSVNQKDKLDALTRLLEVEDFDGMLVFVRTKSATLELAEKLEARGFTAAALNGDLSQPLRERTVERLKKSQLDIIVATDVAARGLDVERISHVVNYDIPHDNESYVHRIGRTGRAGRKGEAILFVTPRERRLLRSIEKSTGQPIEPLQLPAGEEVGARRVEQLLGRLRETLATEDLSRFRGLVEEMAQNAELEVADLAAALLFQSQEARPLFPELPTLDTGGGESKEKRTKKQKKRENTDTGAPSGKAKKSASRSGPEIPMDHYRIEVGREHGATPGDIVGAIANEADIESQYIGRIELHDDHSTIELPEGMPSELLQHLKRVRVRQHRLHMRLLSPASDRPSSRRKPPKTGAGRKKPGRRSETGKAGGKSPR